MSTTITPSARLRRSSADWLVDQTISLLTPEKRNYTPERLGLEFRGAAEQLFSCRDREVLLDGPAGTGKTIAALWYLHLLAANNPGFKGLIARKTQVSLSASALRSFEEWVLPVESFGAKFFGGNKQEEAGYRYPNGSKIAVGGLDKSSKVMSSERDVIFVNEATELTIEDWETLLTRIRYGTIGYNQLLADCNPGPPTHWLNERADQKRVRRLLSRHEDNPRYFRADGEMTADGRDYIEGTLDRLTGVRYKRLRLGQWVAAEGQIYESFDPAIHVLDAIRDAERIRVLLSNAWFFGTVDWGWTNPAVLHVWAVDYDNRLYLVREVYHTRKLVESWLAPLASTLSDEYDFVDWFCDPSEPAYMEQFRALGLNAVGATNDLLPGLGAVQDRLANERIFMLSDVLMEADQSLIDEHLPFSTLSEFPLYVWSKNAQGQLIKDRPVDEHNHGMDALRYAVAALDLGQRPRLDPIVARSFKGLPSRRVA